jgi:hypothetical protein
MPPATAELKTSIATRPRLANDEGRPHGRPSGLSRPVCRAFTSPTPWSASIAGAGLKHLPPTVLRVEERWDLDAEAPVERATDERCVLGLLFDEPAAQTPN